MPNTTTHPVVAALQDAYHAALENLPDVANDPLFGPAELADCCADVAALAHLLRVGDDGTVNIEAYLVD